MDEAAVVATLDVIYASGNRAGALAGGSAAVGRDLRMQLRQSGRQEPRHVFRPGTSMGRRRTEPTRISRCLAEPQYPAHAHTHLASGRSRNRSGRPAKAGIPAQRLLQWLFEAARHGRSATRRNPCRRRNRADFGAGAAKICGRLRTIRCRAIASAGPARAPGRHDIAGVGRAARSFAYRLRGFSSRVRPASCCCPATAALSSQTGSQRRSLHAGAACNFAESA